MLLEQLLNLVPVAEQVRSVDAQFARQVRGRHSLRDAAQEQHNGRTL